MHRRERVASQTLEGREESDYLSFDYAVIVNISALVRSIARCRRILKKDPYTYTCISSWRRSPPSGGILERGGSTRKRKRKRTGTGIARRRVEAESDVDVASAPLTDVDAIAVVVLSSTSGIVPIACVNSRSINGVNDDRDIRTTCDGARMCETITIIGGVTGDHTSVSGRSFATDARASSRALLASSVEGTGESRIRVRATSSCEATSRTFGLWLE